MEDDDAQAAISKNLRLAVAHSYACNAILLEVVKDLVRSQKTGGLKYLDALFDRVGHRLDLLDEEENTHTGQSAATRAAVSSFFAWAKEAAPGRPKPKARASAPAGKRKSSAKKRKRRG
jgi:hypothetical protein